MFSSQMSPEYLDFLKTFYPSMYDVFNGNETLNESVGDNPKLSTFTAVEEFLKDKQLPYIVNLKGKKNFYESMHLTYGVVPLDESLPMYTFNIGIELDENIANAERKTSEVKVICKSSSNTVDVNDFKGQAILNPNSDFSSVYDIVSLCDYDKFFISYWRDALDLISKRNPRIRATFANISTEKHLTVNGRMCTLYVTFDTVRRKFIMGYNPQFILAATLEEYGLYKDKYKSFHQCYLFVLGFVISHEMMHIIHHNTLSNVGILDTNTVNPFVDNIFSDSYINISLSKIYSGLSGDAPPILSNGIVDNFSLRSDLASGGFKKFKSLNDFLRVIGDSVGGVIGIPKVTVSDKGNTKVDFNVLSGAAVYINVYINKDSKLLRESCASVMLVANTTLKNTIEGTLHHSAEGFSEEEKKVMPLDERSEGLLLGSKVKDKKTGKIGVVISDVKGKLRIAFPDNHDLIDELVNDVKQNPKKYSGMTLPDSLNESEVS
jgi:hypothetical protein